MLIMQKLTHCLNQILIGQLRWNMAVNAVYVCVYLVHDDSSYEITMNDRISHFTNYQWQIHKVCNCCG